MKKLLLPSLLLTLVLTGCPSDPQIEEAKGTDADVENSSKVTTVTPNTPQLGTGLPDRNIPGSVYFDYDSYIIRADARPLIDAHAKLLSRRPDVKVTIQGNTDERGSREYNLALGQKRAEAVRRALNMLGARDGQIEAVSLGKERPRCTNITETCYAENRRGDFVYLGKR
ncbi:MAG: peptidoglycan-associated lipoprotein Pal [Azoarcus sp.]|jgi:peptidoglycan-associated lipoprotein|nr:peptidoglycan-associated lipoprotein Pal [Azoarcus sp.]